MNQLSNGNGTNLVLSKQPLVGALYARVSTSRQENEQTVESQVAEIKARIAEDNNILPEQNIFIDDGWTGSLLARPALDALRDSIKRSEVQVLYVYDLGRLSRDFTNQLILIKEIEEAGVKLLSLHDINPENEEQGFIRNIMGSFHAYERIKIADRFRRGKLFRARTGTLINGHSLYGYDYVKKSDNTPAHCLVNEEQVRIIKLIFSWVGNERISLREVIRRLYDMGIPPRKGKNKFWTKGTIVRLLRCETYVRGIVYYNKSEAIVSKKILSQDKYRKVKKNSRRVRPREEWIDFKVPVILDDINLFERVQKILDNNQKYAPRNKKYDYLLSGLATCQCGYPRAGDGSSKHGHYYYRCAQRIYKFPVGVPIEQRCGLQGVNAQIADELVWKELVRHLSEPKLLKSAAQQFLQLEKDLTEVSREKERIGEFIAKITEEEKRYAKAYGTGDLEFEQFQGLMKDAKKKKLAYQVQIDQLETKFVKNESEEVEVDELCAEAAKVMQELDDTNKKKTIQDIIDKVIFKERSEVEVWAHLPLQVIQELGYELTSRNCWLAKRREKHAV